MRNDILDRKDDLLKWVGENKSKAWICKELQCRYATLDRWLEKMGISYKGNQGGKGYKSAPNRMTALEYLQTKHPKTSLIRQKLIEDGIKKECCERCGREVWEGKPIPLQLHHVDGNRWNNDLTNLQILCPNCHSLTPNHCSKNSYLST